MIHENYDVRVFHDSCGQAPNRFKPLEMTTLSQVACHMDLPGQTKPPQLVSDYSDEGCFVYGDTFAFMVHERMQGATAGPAIICRTHVQGLGNACLQAPLFGGGASNNAVEIQNGKLKEARRAKVSDFHTGRKFVVNMNVDAGWGMVWRR